MVFNNGNVVQKTQDFQERFPDDRSCYCLIRDRRWPDGFVCPKCGSKDAFLLTSLAYTYACKECRGHTSVTAGTIMHRTKLALRVWFWAAHLMATHSNGISARQLAAQMGIAYSSAWLLEQKLRRSMIDPSRDLLDGVVEIDQTEIPFHDNDAPRSPLKTGKILIIEAVEIRDRTSGKAQKPKPRGSKYLDTLSGRCRLAVIPSNEKPNIHAFIATNIAPGSTLISDGHASIPGLEGYRHDPRVIGNMAAHIPLQWIHRVFALLKRWGLGTYHGFRREHIDVYLNEFVFRYNRRYYRHVSFETILGIAAKHAPASYWDIVGQNNPRKGITMTRQRPRRRKTAEGMREDGTGPYSRGKNPKSSDDGTSR
nr:transposase [Magnetovibrio blakemorei]